MPTPDFRPKCLCLDIETTSGERLVLRELAAWRADTGQFLHIRGRLGQPHAQALDELAAGAAFVLGHNLARHDLPVLRQLHPGLALHGLGVVDTLELSPIAFPRNPYHRLVKDYKLVRDTRNDPLQDARLALQLWHDQFDAFRSLELAAPAELACHHFLLARQPDRAYNSFFSVIRRAPPPPAAEARGHYLAQIRGRVCATRAGPLLDRALADPALAAPLAYLLAWLRVSGGDSVLPPWVRRQYPVVRDLIRELRETPCGRPECAYCAEHLDPRRDLERHFGFSEFRAEPANAAGGSLQADVVQAGYAGESFLAVLPTGGGKSLCYQLPALSRHARGGGLTVVISPLQSLMKDQVDNLVKRGVHSAAALNGLLSLPERRAVLDAIRLGGIGLLLVSPEQFRSTAFVQAVGQREVAGWVFDEAHCLSRWGNDFRPDYLYVSRFIREHGGDRPAPVYCFTATAKREVQDDLRAHFREALGRELRVLDGGHERDNLLYDIIPVPRAEKFRLIDQLLRAELGAELGAGGGAIVFAASRRATEELAEFLKAGGWACEYFHAGLEAGRKKDVQQAFVGGGLRVIAATNAFGMGVDKPDVRLVIHAEIPGSLENYLQEAGRAGRDREAARCVLLFDEQDVETQFRNTNRSRLTRKDIAGILRALRRHAARAQGAAVVVTPGEILVDEAGETGVEPGSPDAETRVRTAVAWLERARFLERDQNHTRVFPGSLRVNSLAQAAERLARADLPEQQRREHLGLVSLLLNAEPDEGISTDDLMLQLGLSATQCVRMLHALEKLGILSNDLALTVLMRKGVPDASLKRFERLSRLETGLLELLPELAPDAAPATTAATVPDSGANAGWQDLQVRGLCQALKDRCGGEFPPAALLTLLRSLSQPFDETDAAGRGSFEMRVLHREILRVRLLREWRGVRELAARRRAVASVLLGALLARLASGLSGADLRVECKLGELAAALRADADVGPRLRDEAAAIHAGLLYLHDNEVIILERGKSVFRTAMTIRVRPEEKGRRFSDADFAPLKQHYDEKNFQVHVIHEYARLGLSKLSDALGFVLAYFTQPKLDFIRRYFNGRQELLQLATTRESYQRIVEDLRHPLQQQWVAESRDVNRLILAGPGSGKTRVIVHRVAYLLRVRREPAASIVVLVFNRAAAWEIRGRLHALVGSDAAGVTVLTYHALALRLTGTSLAAAGTRGEEPDFERLLAAAVALLKGTGDATHPADEADALRERLLAGYRHVLVDEYQDIDESQYALISALAGRTLRDGDARLSLLAVGDDDQNIYAFRGTSNEFIRRFKADYQAEVTYMVENYRSTAHIVAAANAVIAADPGRLKAEYPIRVNHARSDQPPGGRWAELDPVAAGRVHLLGVPGDPIGQAETVGRELLRLKACDTDADWGDFAVLSRTRVALEPVRAWCEWAGVAYDSADVDATSQPRLHQTREGRALLAPLAAKPGRRLRTDALPRWLRRRFPDGRANPWCAQLAQLTAEVKAAWPGAGVPRGWVLEALYEFAQGGRRTGRGRLTLSTVHAAKGREFRHVLLLDSGPAADAEARRLTYVAMTRARETLTLCQAAANPLFSVLADQPGVLRSAPPTELTRRPELAWLTDMLGFKDVDLSHAGRHPATHPIHAALASLASGDALRVSPGSRELRTAAGTVVGRLSRAYTLPAGRIVRATVGSLVWRSREHSTEGAQRERLQVEEWWVVLPVIVVAPDPVSPPTPAKVRSAGREHALEKGG